MWTAVRHNWGLKLLSLILGTGTWLYVQNLVNPPEKRVLTVPVQVSGVPPDLVVTDVDPPTVTVEIVGRRDQIARLQPRLVGAQAEARQIQGVEATVPLVVRGLPYRTAVTRLDPQTVRITLDKRAGAERGTAVRTTGKVPLGIEIVGWQTTPPQVAIEGPAGRVSAVARVEGSVDVTGLSEPKTLVVQWQAVDKAGQPVPGVTVSPSEGTAEIDVQHIEVRNVPIQADLSSPPPGYAVTAIVVEPYVAAVTGDREAIAHLAHLSTGRVDLSDARGSFRRAVALVLPSGVRALGSGSVIVSVTLRAVGRETPRSGAPAEESGPVSPSGESEPAPGPGENPAGARPEPTPPATPRHGPGEEAPR